MQIASLNHRDEILATDNRTCVEVVAPRMFAERVEVDVAFRVTEEAQAPAGLEEGAKRSS
jgi:hypothetical protein